MGAAKHKPLSWLEPVCVCVCVCVFVCVWLLFCSHKTCYTSLPSGNQVDGLLPVVNLAGDEYR